MEAYCVKCRKKVEIKSDSRCTLKHGRKAVKGKCGHCGTTVCRITG